MRERKLSKSESAALIQESSAVPNRGLKAYFQAWNLSYQVGLNILQLHGYIDCDHNWSQEVLRKGYVYPVSFVTTDPQYGIETRVVVDLISPEGEFFFNPLFEQYGY